MDVHKGLLGCNVLCSWWLICNGALHFLHSVDWMHRFINGGNVLRSSVMSKLADPEYAKRMKSPTQLMRAERARWNSWPTRSKSRNTCLDRTDSKASPARPKQITAYSQSLTQGCDPLSPITTTTIRSIMECVQEGSKGSSNSNTDLAHLRLKRWRISVMIGERHKRNDLINERSPIEQCPIPLGLCGIAIGCAARTFPWHYP
ncbi:hypothetical protein EDD15DRAFT_1686892 [Pisolithus albus]|nr:hypothetical protein EDD15DRAFT_1686892 [Pisolithus albus]